LSHSSRTTGIRPYVPLAIRRGPLKTEATKESRLRLVFCAWRVNNQKTVKVEYFTIHCQRQPFSCSEERTAVVRQQERVMDCACCSSVNRGRELVLPCVYTWPCPLRLRTFHTTAEENIKLYLSQYLNTRPLRHVWGKTPHIPNLTISWFHSRSGLLAHKNVTLLGLILGDRGFYSVCFETG